MDLLPKIFCVQFGGKERNSLCLVRTHTSVAWLRGFFKKPREREKIREVVQVWSKKKRQRVLCDEVANVLRREEEGGLGECWLGMWPAGRGKEGRQTPHHITTPHHTTTGEPFTWSSPHHHRRIPVFFPCFLCKAQWTGRCSIQGRHKFMQSK